MTYDSVPRLNYSMVHCGMITLCILWTQLFLLPLAAFGSTPTFDYDPRSPSEPTKWGSLSPAWNVCQSGQQQSPIAIQFSESTVNQSLGRLNFSYVPSQGVLINTGHAVEVSFAAGAGRLTLGKDTYKLEQFHFHAPSEHVINNVRFPLEMHLVHKTADGSKIAVIGVIFWKGCRSHFLDQFWKKLPNVSEMGANVNVGEVQFNDLHLGPSYARYMGSLTTPPCTQNVTWSVALSLSNTVSQSQLNDLARIITEPNARPLQARNGRKIEIYKYRGMPPIHTASSHIPCIP